MLWQHYTFNSRMNRTRVVVKTITSIETLAVQPLSKHLWQLHPYLLITVLHSNSSWHLAFNGQWYNHMMPLYYMPRLQAPCKQEFHSQFFPAKICLHLPLPLCWWNTSSNSALSIHRYLCTSISLFHWYNVDSFVVRRILPLKILEARYS